MLFNSTAFGFFLVIVFAIYWSIGSRRIRLRNALLIVASYTFYGWWDWRFLILIFLSSLTDYLIGRHLERTENPRGRRALLGVSLLVNLGFLGFFKYCNFFLASFTDLLTALGLQANPYSLRIILPVGISFYTFQTLSYTIDIYRRRLKSTRDPITFFAFVSFFPQLVAGPIERAKSLLPQFESRRRFDEAKVRDGLRQMLWGFAKKIIVADNLAPHVERIFANAGSLDGVTLSLGAFFFAIQIYCDFSGYTDIAIGTARLFGIDLMRNFAFPYFSRDIAEFWRRWHISLSTWFRDYLYIPLGGNRVGRARSVFNIMATFTVSGLWHGANWTFIVWGALNGLYYIPLLLRGRQRRHMDTVAAGRLFAGVRESAAMCGTFLLTLLAWVFFRAESIGAAGAYLRRIATHPYLDLNHGELLAPITYAVIPIVLEWHRREEPHGLSIAGLPGAARYCIYLIIVLGILLFGRFGSQEFIYFQF